MRCIAALLFLTATAWAHDMATAVTWSREISRLVNRHCAGCHRDNGSAFPLTTFREAHDRAPAIARAVLTRRMPPFGAVKGFGDLRDDTSLTQEQIELFVKWAQAGAMEGDPTLSLKDPLPPPPAEGSAATGTAWEVKGTRTLDKPMTFRGITAVSIPSGASVRIVAQKPDGSVEPLIWFNAYDPKFARTWLFRKPMALPAGTRIVSSVPDGVTFSLLSGT
jgi:hypothetical protein